MPASAEPSPRRGNGSLRNSAGGVMSEKMSRSGLGVLSARRRSLTAAAAVGVAVALAGNALAAPYEVDWVGTTGDYTNGANWGAFAAPHTAPYNRDATDQANNVDNPFLDIGNGG